MTSSTSKRARTAAVLDYRDVSVDQLVLGANGEPLLGGDVPRINLTPTGSLLVRYGFNLSGDYEKPGFLIEDTEAKGNWLSIRIGLESAQVDFLKAFEEKCRQDYLETHSDVQWHPLLTLLEKEDLWTVKVRVYFSGTMSLIKVWEEHGPVLVTDWEQARELMEWYHCFRRADAKVVVKPQIWNYGGKAGIKLMTTQLSLRPAVDPPEMDVFVEPDW